MNNQEKNTTTSHETKETRAGIYTDKKRNQFMKLRYHDDKSKYPFISINELADSNSTKYIGLSKSIIAKLEGENIDRKNPPCRASTLRLYKEYFDCSYDYLMGDTECKKPEYYSIGKDPVLGLFDDTFYDNLKTLMSDIEFQRFNKYMLEAFMSTPAHLQYFMQTLFLHMYEIHRINNDNSLKKAEKDIQTSYYWYSLNIRLKEYFETILMPSLEYGFQLHETLYPRVKADPNRDKAAERQAFEEELPTLDLDNSAATTGEYEESLPTQQSKISNIKVTLVSEKDSQ